MIIRNQARAGCTLCTHFRHLVYVSVLWWLILIGAVYILHPCSPLQMEKPAIFLQISRLCSDLFYRGPCPNYLPFLLIPPFPKLCHRGHLQGPLDMYIFTLSIISWCKLSLINSVSFTSPSKTFSYPMHSSVLLTVLHHFWHWKIPTIKIIELFTL